VITIRKLESLPERTRARKLMTLLREESDQQYTRELVRLCRDLLGDLHPVTDLDTTRRMLSAFRQRLAVFLGIAVADWDLQAPTDRVGPALQFPFSVWLDDVRSPFNVGSIVRTAEAFGFEAVLRSELTPGSDHPRARRSSMGADEFVSVSALSLDSLKSLWGNRAVFALELGGISAERFGFPPEGLVLVGGEELGLSPEALAWADASLGRVSIPLYGRKASLNVGVSFGILAAYWTQKAEKNGSRNENSPRSPAVGGRSY